MGVPFAVPLGVIVFFGTFIPYIGAPIAMFLAAFVAFVTNGIVAGLLVVVLIFLIGQIEGNVLQPLIMGHSVNLHPVGIVMVTALATAYFGLLGALVGVPIAAAIYGIMKYVTGRNGPQTWCARWRHLIFRRPSRGSLQSPILLRRWIIIPISIFAGGDSPCGCAHTQLTR